MFVAMLTGAVLLAIGVKAIFDVGKGVEMIDLSKLCERMKALQDELDVEDAHGKADDILCDALKELGCGELVELYDKVEKWYA